MLTCALCTCITHWRTHTSQINPPGTLGGRLETLQLGRHRGRLTKLFDNPELGRNTHNICNQVNQLTHSDSEALEFVLVYDLSSISIIIAIPPLASIIFAIIWMVIFVHREGVDLQVLVGTTFTGSSYIMNTGRSWKTDI